MVGVDAGVAHTLTTSDGQHFDMPALLSPGEARRLRLLQRSLSRQHKRSKRREHTKRSIARLKAKETDRRKNWVEQTTTTLVRGYDLIAVENLQVRSMVRSASGTVEQPGVNVTQKRALNRAITRQAWATIRQRLCDKAAAATSPVTVVTVPPANTSRRCAACGHVAQENRENQAVFRCAACKHAANADVNAANNILAAGRAVTGREGSREQADEPSTLLVA
jgi:putative transposase